MRWEEFKLLPPPSPTLPTHSKQRGIHYCNGSSSALFQVPLNDFGERTADARRLAHRLGCGLA